MRKKAWNPKEVSPFLPALAEHDSVTNGERGSPSMFARGARDDQERLHVLNARLILTQLVEAQSNSGPVRRIPF